MASIDQFYQARTVNMRIDLRRTDVAMPQQALQGSQVGSSFKEMGCKGMAQDMRADICRVDPCPDSMFLDDLV